ncbi:hypothetical protein ISS30_07750 [bacterium]|nr:hypothetical protein [FCB group bacterium]MBL7191576.1 hypothetical protein [bacterium]
MRRNRSYRNVFVLISVLSLVLLLLLIFTNIFVQRISATAEYIFLIIFLISFPLAVIYHLKFRSRG